MGASSRGRRLFLILISGVLLALTLSGTPFAIAGHSEESLPGSNFELDTDANLKVDDAGREDWASIPSPPEARRADLPTGKNDDSFAGGSKEDDACPGTTTGSIPNNKSDLRTFGVYQEPGAPGFVHLFWSRVQEPNGTTLMDFEFNKSGTDCGNGVNKVRSVDDLLIEYRLEQGGATATILARKWQGTQWGPAQDLTAIGMAAGTINDSPIPAADADGIGAHSPRTFGEASIDLNFLFDPTVCTSFGSVFVKSRSSTSFTSQLKDFILPLDVNISNCGEVTIRKETIPNGAAGSFEFTSSDPTQIPTFNLSDDGSNSLDDVLAGSYMITETNPSSIGFDLVGINCSASAVATPVDVITATRSISFTLAAGDKVDCTYTNEARGKIIIDKETDPSGDPQSFDFTLTGGPSNLNQSFSLTDAATPHDSGMILSGDGYNAAETVPTGWDLDSATCDDGSPVNNIDVAPGETVTCTFENVKRGTIIVEKQTDPDGRPETFDFTGDASGSIADNQTITVSNLQPGTYTSTEADPSPDFDLTDISCDDGASDTASSGNVNTRTATFELDPGETVTCTFTNERNTGAILITKTAKNYTAGGSAPLAGVSFEVSLNGGQIAKVMTDANGEACVDGLTVDETYSVEETAAPTGYALDPNNPQDVTVNNFTDCGTGNEDTVSFDNDPLSKITITFDSLAGPGVTIADSVVCTGPNGFDSGEIGPLADTESASITDLLEGVYVCTISVDP